MVSLSLLRPTTDDVRQKILRFDQEQETVELALSRLFGDFPHNDEREIVLLKVVAINSLYVTGILAIYQMAEHIYELNREYNIDQMMREGDPQAIAIIANFRIGEKTRYNYSFATKYCSWHKPEAYPIYDSYVEWLLWEYKKNYDYYVYRRFEFKEYERFKQIIINFQEYFGLTAYSFKEIDKFLWLEGKDAYIRTQENSL